MGQNPDKQTLKNKNIGLGKMGHITYFNNFAFAIMTYFMECPNL